MYRYWLIFAVLCGFMISASADIYKWVDPNGVVHYSDVPGSPNAVQVQINADQVVPSSSSSAPPSGNSPGPVPSAFSNPSSPSSPPPPPSPQQTYTAVVITEPTDQYTYVNNESGNIVVKVALTPSLQDGNFIQVLFDGSPVGKPQATTNLKLENVDRGEHTVQAQVLDSTGAILATSNKVTFFLQRIKVMNRNSLNDSNSIASNNSNNSSQTSAGNNSSQNTSQNVSHQNTGNTSSTSPNTSGTQGTEGVA